MSTDAADYLGITPRQLADLRYQGDGPAFVKISHKVVRYRRADLDAWIESRVRTQTGEA